jgi:hypothetical protein
MELGAVGRDRGPRDSLYDAFMPHSAPPVAPAGATAEIHYAPDENLEPIAMWSWAYGQTRSSFNASASSSAAALSSGRVVFVFSAR